MDFLKDQKLMDKNHEYILAEKVISDAVFVLYYFNASWCDTVESTNVLETLKLVNEEARKRDIKIVIIFVSLDNDDTGFSNSFAKQGNWYIIPYYEDLSHVLRYAYSITTIPTTVVVQQNGNIITTTGNADLIEKGINVLVIWTD